MFTSFVKGGFVVIVMRREFLDHVDEYRGRLVPRMEKMQSEGVWRMIEKKTVINFAFGKDGMVFILKMK